MTGKHPRTMAMYKQGQVPLERVDTCPCCVKGESLCQKNLTGKYDF
ncbi:MAG: hypothetical protein PT947_07440 [Suipraeoptans intestinalis]|nr:hypothetical protein [Suipraeoptans intestinalis]